MKFNQIIKQIIGLTFLVGLNHLCFAQSYATVIAPSSLSVRSQPNLQAERIGKLEFGQNVEIKEVSGKTLEVKDGNKWVRGNWVKIASKDGITGYAFDGYLLGNIEHPERTGLGCEEELPCDSKVEFDAFTAIIHSYQSEKRAMPPSGEDTLFYYEYVFNDLSEKVLQIIPEQAGDRIEVFYNRFESLTEQPLNRKDPDFSWEKWAREREYWGGTAEFVKMKGKNNFFRIPLMEYTAFEKQLKQKMGLRDTMVIIEGEYDVTATVLYKEKVCLYMIDRAIIKVVVHRGEEEIVRYLDVVLSYGC